MDNSLRDLLKNKSFNQPEEFIIIKKFVFERFQETPELKTQNKTIIIMVKGSALAGSLQLVLHELKELLPSNVKVRIQIT